MTSDNETKLAYLTLMFASAVQYKDGLKVGQKMVQRTEGNWDVKDEMAEQMYEALTKCRVANAALKDFKREYMPWLYL